VCPFSNSKNIQKKKYALKIIKKGLNKDVHAECLAYEIKVMKTLRKVPNVIQLHQLYEDSENVYILMDYKCGGNLK